MKDYPSIEYWSGNSLGPVYVFDKLDGSNVRATINRKGTFTKFGKRHGLLDDQTPFLNQAKDIILNKYGESLPKIAKDNRWDESTFFFEFCGPNSFAGVH